MIGAVIGNLIEVCFCLFVTKRKRGMARQIPSSEYGVANLKVVTCIQVSETSMAITLLPDALVNL